MLEGTENIFENWCRHKKTTDGRKTLWRLTEREGGRDDILEDLADRVRDHYISDDEIAAFLEALGYPKTADCIRELFPTTLTGKSGDLGEILAAELIKERLGHSVPVKKLRDKDHRDMAMRGEDIIGVDYDDRARLKLLKGESKSAQVLGTDTVIEARSGLESNHGRPSAHSLIFLARRLLQNNDEQKKKMGTDLLEEAVTKAVPKNRITHLLFTLTGNAAGDMLDNDFDAADGGRKQHSVHLRIQDHSIFVAAVFEAAVFEEVTALGDD